MSWPYHDHPDPHHHRDTIILPSPSSLSPSSHHHHHHNHQHQQQQHHHTDIILIFIIMIDTSISITIKEWKIKVMFCSQWSLQNLPVKQSPCAFFLQPDPLPFMENSHLVLLCLPGTKPWSSYSLDPGAPGSDWVSGNQSFQSLALDRKWEPWRLSPLRIALITCLCVPCEDRGRWRV